MKLVQEIVSRIEPVSEEFAERARARQQSLTKPPGSLGQLELVAERLCAIQKTSNPRVTPSRMVLFAADHGVSAEGVSPYPSEVTAQMVQNFASGGAAINAFSKVADADVVVVNVGVKNAATIDAGRVALYHESVRPGTRNMVDEPAMTAEEVERAIFVGAKYARRAKDDGRSVVGVGEMGIGNTTASSAISAVLTAEPVSWVTGRGTGSDDERWRHKVSVIEKALERHRLSADEPVRVLECVGGLEIAALCGFYLEAASSQLPFIVDGFITTAALAIAHCLEPRVADYAIFSHVSAEPGHRALLKLMDARPLFDFDLRLGEGTGAALAIPLMKAAVTAHNEMATFESAGVSEKPE